MSLIWSKSYDSRHSLLAGYLDRTSRESSRCGLLLPTACAAGTRKVGNADSLAGIGNGRRALHYIPLKSCGKYEGMLEFICHENITY